MNKASALREARDCAEEYFRDRDKLAVSKDNMLDRMLVAANDFGATQEEIRQAVTFEEKAEWRFHRTRIQQFLREARIRALMKDRET